MTGSIRDYGMVPGHLPTGPRNKISDVAGVTVGHCTVDQGDYHTGVTVILPGQDNPFFHKYTAACYVHNGFGKTCGLIQIEELGTLESPIALTSTLNVGKVQDALLEYLLDRCRREGQAPRSINAVVGECNDGRLSHIAGRPVGQQEVLAAIGSATPDFQLGAVGAGRGTICYGFKGGIGSASRVLSLGDKSFTLGVLVQTNFGAPGDLRILGKPAPNPEHIQLPGACDAGSVMVILATDLPLSSRQLRRVLRRCGVGLARTGSYLGHGSGEIMIGFTTENRIPSEENPFLPMTILREELLDPVFQAAAEATEEAVLSSLWAAESLRGYTGLYVPSLREVLFPSADGEGLRASPLPADR